jgi:N-acetylmuramoyl-L-alanine amidase
VRSCFQAGLLLLLPLALAGCAGGSRRHAPDFTVVSDQQVMVPDSAFPGQPPANPPPAGGGLSNSMPPRQFVPPVPRVEDRLISLEDWSKRSGFGPPHHVDGYVPPAYTVPTTNGTLFLRVGSQNASWDGLEYLLGFAPQIIGGRPFVHSLDVQKNFEPFLNPPAPPARSNLVIVLDPGHGGSDTGAQSVVNGHYEKEYTLDLARRLQPLLASNGWTVLLTRIGDYNVALSNRVSFAEHHHADLFLSLHFNSAAPDHEQAGLETYCLTPAGMPSNLTRGFRDDPSLAFPNNNFDAQNLQYAAFIHRSVLKINGHLDRGIRRARFLGVLQNQNRPAILVEGGFLSNPAEATHIAEPAYRQKMAEALAAAFVEYNHADLALATHPAPALPDAAAARVPEIKTN